MLAVVPQNPLIEILWLCVCNSCVKSSIDHVLDGLDLIFLGQHGDVVLEGVWDPQALVADVGDALMGVPVAFVGKSLVDAVVKVLVVGEDDVAANIVELAGVSTDVLWWNWRLGGRHTKPSGVTSVEARPPGTSLLSTIIQSGPLIWFRRLAAPRPVGPAPMTRTSTSISWPVGAGEGGQCMCLRGRKLFLAGMGMGGEGRGRGVPLAFEIWRLWVDIVGGIQGWKMAVEG